MPNARGLFARVLNRLIVLPIIGATAGILLLPAHALGQPPNPERRLHSLSPRLA
jgi:hypothetical protein